MRGGAFPLPLRHVSDPFPVPHSGVIRHDLAFFVIRVAGLAHGRYPHLNPVLNIHNRRIRFPVRLLTFVNDLELFAKPIDGGPD